MSVQPTCPPHPPRQDQDRGFQRPSFDTQIRPIEDGAKTLSQGGRESRRGSDSILDLQVQYLVSPREYSPESSPSLSFCCCWGRWVLLM
jgi:hypothetical protein